MDEPWNFASIMAIYTGSNGDATRGLYFSLEKLGPAGIMAVNIFRACKASERAKKYRGGGYRVEAYQKKDWSLGNLCDALNDHANRFEITWGWGTDPKAIGYEHVLYIDLPTGQMSFHNARRISGPDYQGKWDEVRDQGPTRICRWIDTLFNGEGSAT